MRKPWFILEGKVNIGVKQLKINPDRTTESQKRCRLFFYRQ